MGIKKYQKKRDLKKSKEPSPKIRKRSTQLHFVVQKHAARRLHYDFRLEAEGVLKSWAVPKGPSLNPKEKRLAIMVEDHPFDYKDFEGVIPEGYGAGTVMVWDRGTYTTSGKNAQESEHTLLNGLKKGEIQFSLNGEKLRGSFALVRIDEDKNEWLLIKKKDAFSTARDVLVLENSVLSGMPLEAIGMSGSFPAEWMDKAPKRTIPRPVSPMLSTLIDKPFDHPGWLFEIKWDGYRAIAEVGHKKVALYSRNFKSFLNRFSHIVQNLKSLPFEGILDGEIVATDAGGIPRFQLLQTIKQQKENIFYYVFDLLSFQGHDLRTLPLMRRKEILKAALDPFQGSFIRYADHVEGKGIEFFKACVQKGLEGIVGKKKDSHYKEGKRSREWVKIKYLQRQEALICGFTEPKGKRQGIGALLLGLYKQNKLVFIGHVGGGFTEKKLKEIKKKLTPLIQKTAPFENPPKTNAPVTWVKPHFLCEVSFSEWTSEGMLRQPIFLGLREDKPPKSVVKEQPRKAKNLIAPPAPKLKLTNLDKAYWPDEKITKGDVIAYYEAIAPFILPYLKDRPQSLKRYPNGIFASSFFQKNMQKVPDWIQTHRIQHTDKTVQYLLIQDLDSLLYAVNLGCIELHPFLSRISSLERPDFLVFDLDPENISFEKVVETALTLHDILESLKVPSVCKTSGATGLHIYVPLQAQYTYDQAQKFSLMIAWMAHHRIPEITSLKRSPKQRQKKVYIDCFQNSPGQTIAAPYSLRALPSAPVSTPLEWEEINKLLDPLSFNIYTFMHRLHKKGDLFKTVLGKGMDMASVLKKMENA